MPMSMSGLHPTRSVNLAKIGIDTACANKQMEKIQGN